MNVIDAAHQTVKAYPGGAESLGPRVGISPAVLRSKVNPNTTTHHLTLAEAGEVMSVTGDHRILHALAGELGYVLRAAEPDEVPGTLLQSILAANAAESAFDRLLHEALADEVLTPNEFKEVSEMGLKQQATLMMLLQKLAVLANARKP